MCTLPSTPDSSQVEDTGVEDMWPTPRLPVVSCNCVSGYIKAPRRLGWSEATSGDHPESPGNVGAECPDCLLEAAGGVAWMFLVVLWQASLEVQDQAQRVQQLQRKQEVLER